MVNSVRSDNSFIHKYFILFVLDKVLATDEELLAKSSSMFLDALNAAIKDPINNIKVKGTVTPGNKIVILGEKILNTLKEHPECLCSKTSDLVSELIDAIRSVSFSKAASRELMWQKVLSIMQDKSFFKHWNDVLILSDSEESVVCSLFNFICMRIIHSIIKFENERNLESEIVPDLKLNDEEQQVLYYVAGYIVYSLLKKYRTIEHANPTSATASAAIQFLLSLKLENTSEIKVFTFLDFVRSWVNIRDRGDSGSGLIKVGNPMYLLVRRIENSVRTVLNVDFIGKYRGEDLRDIIHQEIKKSTLIHQYWESLSRNLPNKVLANLLKEQIITKWIDIRAHAFVKAYVQMLRRNLSKTNDEKKSKMLSKSAEPALRKTLY